MPGDPPLLSVIVITHNEARNITACLASVAWAPEIVVVDAESQDDTVRLCREFAAAHARPDFALRLLVRPWPGFASQKQFALDQAGGYWVLSLDADERVTPELADEIRQIIASPSGKCGYFVPRLSTFLGRYIRHSGWYPGYQLRLFRRDRVSIRHVHVHEGFEVEGECGHLQHDLLHLTHRTLEESLERMNRYSTLEARDRAGRRVHWWDFFLHPLSAFWNRYVVHQGWRDGMHGLILALITATVKMALYMKLWEASQRQQEPP